MQHVLVMIQGTPMETAKMVVLCLFVLEKCIL
jgi:hypothetical protein